MSERSGRAAPGLAWPNRRELLLGGAALTAAGIAYARIPRRRTTLIVNGQLDRLVPLTIGPWRYESASGLVLPPPDQLAQLLYSQQLSRYYTAEEGLPIMLVMAYGSSQSGMLQIHRPEICYPAGGFRLSETIRANMVLASGRAIPVRQFTATSDARVEQLLYWTRIGDMLPSSWAQQRIAVMRANLDGYIPDGLLVRISTITQNAAEGQAAVRRFGKAMLAAVGPLGQRLLIGSGNR